TLYLNEVLATGLSPETLAEYVGQRSRWAQGTLQTLFLPGGPVRARGLSLLDRIFCLEGATFWNSVLGVPILVLAPARWPVSGIPFMSCPAAAFFGLFLPRIVVREAVHWWLREKRVMPLIEHVTRLITMVVIVPTVLRTFIWPFRRSFRVTLKGQSRDQV